MKILAIWITKGLFIFVICIAEWNVCSNLSDFKNINSDSSLNTLSFNDLASQGTSIAMIPGTTEGTPSDKVQYYMVITQAWLIGERRWSTQLAISKSSVPSIYVRSSNASNEIILSPWYRILCSI